MSEYLKQFLFFCLDPDKTAFLFLCMFKFVFCFLHQETQGMQIHLDGGFWTLVYPHQIPALGHLEPVLRSVKGR